MSLTNKISTEIDIEEIKDAVALLLVNILTGSDRRRIMSLLPADQREDVRQCRGEITSHMAKSRSGMFREDFWNFTLDLAFDRNTKFSSYVFKSLCSWVDKDIAEAATKMMDFKEKLKEDKLEKGAAKDLSDEEAREHREWLEERLKVANIELEHAWRVGKVMKDIVWALNEGEHAKLLRGRLYDL